MSFFFRRFSLVALQKAWNEADHPREPAGSERGGEFTHAGGAPKVEREFKVRGPKKLEFTVIRDPTRADLMRMRNEASDHMAATRLDDFSNTDTGEPEWRVVHAYGKDGKGVTVVGDSRVLLHMDLEKPALQVAGYHGAIGGFLRQDGDGFSLAAGNYDTGDDTDDAAFQRFAKIIESEKWFQRLNRKAKV